MAMTDNKAPWESEYMREFTWKTPYLPKPPVLCDDAVQTTLPTVDDAAQTTPVMIEPVAAAQQHAQTQSEPVPSETQNANVQFASAPEKQFQNNYQIDKLKTDPPPMMPFGNGNTRPVAPQNLLKTFNVRAPSDQIYPNTLERAASMRPSSADPIQPSNAKDAVTDRPRIPNPKDALRQYIQARNMVHQLQSMYKTEYSSEFLDWSKTYSKIANTSHDHLPPLPSPTSHYYRNALPHNSIPMYSHPFAAGVPSGQTFPPESAIQVPDGDSVLFSTTPNQPNVAQKPAQNARKQNHFVEAVPRVTDLSNRTTYRPRQPHPTPRPPHTQQTPHKIPSASSRLPPPPTLINAQQSTASQPTRSISIFDQINAIPAAGVTETESHTHYERRHYVLPKDTLQVQTEELEHLQEATAAKIPETWNLAKDVLKRAKARNLPTSKIPLTYPFESNA